MRPGRLERLELGPDRICADTYIVDGAITGYGLEGEDRDRAGDDVGAFWRGRGLAHTMALRQMPPGLRSRHGDHQAMTLVAGDGELFDRENAPAAVCQHQPPAHRDVLDRLGLRHPAALRPPRGAADKSRAPLINSYRAGDDRIFWLICLEADRHWPIRRGRSARPGR